MNVRTITIQLYVCCALWSAACSSEKETERVQEKPEIALAEKASAQSSEDVRGDTPHQNPECRACREQNCVNYSGINLVQRCFANEDPKFTEQCIAAMNCAHKHKCGYGRLGSAECYCGEGVEPPECLTPGGAKGPCQAEFYAAARAASLQELSDNFGYIERPSGVVFYLQECDREACPMCVP